MGVLVEAGDGYRTEQHVNVSKCQRINSQEIREVTAATPYAENLLFAGQLKSSSISTPSRRIERRVVSIEGRNPPTHRNNIQLCM